MDQELDLSSTIKLILKDNVLAITSKKELSTISSAIFNGGYKHVRAVLNIGVPQGYSDLDLHIDPMKLIKLSANKLCITKDYLAMITAANVHNFSLVRKESDNFTVSVVATAGCSHGESSGEEIDVQEITGTINIIVLIEGNPTESCMVSALITATEAKSAVLRDFDVRSRYTGDSATGSITDSVTIVSNECGKKITLAGPASKLGKLVGQCTRKAVTEALLKQEPIWANRTVIDRLCERHLPLEKLATELSKIDSLNINAEKLAEIIKKKPVNGAFLLAATKMDDDYKKNLRPTEYKEWETISKHFGKMQQIIHNGTKELKYENINIPPFLKYALINIIKNNQT